MAHAEVALVSMPFGGIHTPSLALSLLSAALSRAGISSAVHYLNLAFAERIGLERYDRYAENLNGVFLGEWLFSDCLFPRPQEEGERFVEEVLIPLRRFTLEEIEQFEGDRGLAGPFLQDCLRLVDWSRYRIIGFTTTFEQNTPSLAFARMLKASAPDSTVVFGGANCEGEMGVQIRKSFPWVDFVCTGEGDEVFPELARQILGGGPSGPLPGIVGPGHDPPQPPRMVMDLDRLPHPDFSAYFQRAERSPLRERLRPRLLMETSRGCWWGEKHHCTFCGLNGGTMRFRSKSGPRALEEIAQLTERYQGRVDPTCSIYLTDNILDLKYLTTLLPAVRDAGLGISLFYETKANLTKDQVRILADSGVRVIQPGIESLHSDLLRLMRKGCTAAQNLQLLKWCQEFQIHPLWNILFGFPGEDPRWFQEQVETIRKIPHLTPPDAVCPVRLDRFSPYFARPADFGISRLRPARALSYVYALPADELARIAYHFDFDFEDGREPVGYAGPLVEAVREWMALAKDRFFLAFRWHERLMLWDGRFADPGTMHTLEGGRQGIYEFCDRYRGREEVMAFAQREAGIAAKEADRMLDEWIEAGLLLEEQGRLLALAVSATGAVESQVTPDTVSGGGEGPRGDGEALDRWLSRRPLRQRGAKAIEMGEETIVLDRDRGRMLILRGIASAAWRRCDGTRTIEAIAKEIAGAASRPRIRREVTQAARSLEEAGLLDCPASSGSVAEPRGRGGPVPPPDRRRR